ncbi:MAG: hypothetical protein V1728_02270 [Candidatus Micrarchaeota archaeon]
MKRPNASAVLLAFALLLALAPPLHCEGGLSYVLSLSNENNTLSLNSYSLALGDAPDHAFQPADGHHLAILDAGGRTLYSLNFSLNSSLYYSAPIDFFDDNGTQVRFGNESSGAPPRPTVSPRPPLLVVPYFADARAIRIRDPGGKPLLSIDVSRYAHADAASLSSELSSPNTGEPASLWLTVLLLSLFLLAGAVAYHLAPKPKKKSKKKKIGS